MKAAIYRYTNASVFGLVAGVDAIAYALALGTFLFTGPLIGGAELGFGAVMLGMIICAMVVGQFSGQKNAVGEVQETAFGALIVALAAMSAHMAHAPDPDKIATALAIIGSSTLVTALLILCVGALQLGQLVRFLPHPVIAGFLAGTGWILFSASAEMMVRAPINFDIAGAITAHVVIGIMVPSLLLVVTLSSVSRWFPHPFIVPGVLIACVALFYLVLFVFGIGTDEARELGWMSHPSTSVGIVLPSPSLLHDVHWDEVWKAAPFMASVALITLIGTMLKWTGLELVLAGDLNIDRELIVTGFANLFSGFLGSPTGFVGFRTTILANDLGARNRGASIAVTIVLILGLFFSKSLISFTPTFFTAGLMLYGSVELLVQWAVQSRKQMSRIEWSIVIIIMLIIVVFGILYGIIAGFLISSLTFVYNYSQLPAVRTTIGGHELRSLVDRSAIETRYLTHNGHAIQILRLQGYLFFGTAEGIIRSVRNRLSSDTSPPLVSLLLDFSHVSGADSSAATCFVKIRNLVRAQNATLYFCNLSPDLEQTLRRTGNDFGGDGVFLSPDVDHALEICEDMILAGETSAIEEKSFEFHVASILGENVRIPDLIAMMDRLELEVGETLIRAGQDADDVFIIALGRVKVQVQLQDGRNLRLRSMTTGAIVGEIGLYLNQKRTADIVVEQKSIVYRMRGDTLNRLEREDAVLASLFHRLIAVSLSEKMVMANRLISRAKE